MNGAHSHDELELRIEAIEARLAALEHAEPTPAPEPTPDSAPEPEPTPAPTSPTTLSRYDGAVSISGSAAVDANRDPIDPWKLKVGSVTLVAGRADQSPRDGYIITGSTPLSLGRVDPIVVPGGMSHHEHRFVGLPDDITQTQAASLTTADVLAMSTFPSKLVAWMPAADASIKGNTGYVENRHGATCGPLPQGLRAISDDYFWKDQGGNWSLVIKFGDWWDGRLDSPDHRSHLSSTATATHTRRIPEIRWHWTFDRAYTSPKPILSSEPMHGPHMDVICGDDPRLAQALADHVLNAGRTMGRMTER